MFSTWMLPLIHARVCWRAGLAHLRGSARQHYPRALCRVISPCTGPSQPEVWLLSPHGLTRLGTPNPRPATAPDPPSSSTAWHPAPWASAGRQEAARSAWHARWCVFAVRRVHGFGRRGARLCSTRPWDARCRCVLVLVSSPSSHGCVVTLRLYSDSRLKSRGGA